MKIAFKNSGNFFLWVILPIFILTITILSVSFIPKEAESRLGVRCDINQELYPCYPSSIPGETTAQCLQRLRDAFCDGDRTAADGREYDEVGRPLRCRTQRCATTACVLDRVDTSQRFCLAQPGCGDLITQRDLGEQCDTSPDGALGEVCPTRDFPRGYSCLDCHCVTTCGDGFAVGDEQCDQHPGGGPAAFNPRFTCEAGSTCSNKCQCIPPPRCGDGRVDPAAAGHPIAEQCDSGSLTSSSTTADRACKRLNGAGSTCDPATCQCNPVPRCGDGNVDSTGDFTPVETCDPGSTPASATAANDYCTRVNGMGSTCSSCTCTPPPPAPACEDGSIDTSIGEQCDPGRGSVNQAAENTRCEGIRGPGSTCTGCRCSTPPICGDGTVDAAIGTRAAETCDPGRDAGHAASALAICERLGGAGSTCNSTSCQCNPAPICGDGVRNDAIGSRPREQCDAGVSNPSAAAAAQVICTAEGGLGSTCNTSTCRCNPAPVCGDGHRDDAIGGRPAEVCDPGTSNPTAAAAADRICAGLRGAGSTCSASTCSCSEPPPPPAECGDGTLDPASATRPAEQCEPGRGGVNQAAANARCEGLRGAGSTCVGCQCSTAPTCGDGNTDPAIGTRAAEQCDLGTTEASRVAANVICESINGAGATCTAGTCSCGPAPFCGDGTRDEAVGGRPREQCDPGTSTTSIAAANSFCETERGTGSTCVSCQCTPPPPPPAECRDGNVDPGEVCDPGRSPGTLAAANASCASLRGRGSVCESCLCTTPPPRCGDGTLNTSIGEECDRTDGTCPTLCTERYGPTATYDTEICKCSVPTPVCGNSIREVGEECDTTAAGCSTSGSTCSPPTVPGTTPAIKGCRCIPPVTTNNGPICGDGKVNRDPETCDSFMGNTDLRNPTFNLLSGCRMDCTYCGDGIKNGDEECDPRASPADLPPRTFCSNSCKIQPKSDLETAESPPTCGDNSVNNGESCDVVNGKAIGCPAEVDCYTCQCVPTYLEGSGFKCSFDPAVENYSVKTALIALSLLCLGMLVPWALRRKVLKR